MAVTQGKVEIKISLKGDGDAAAVLKLVRGEMKKLGVTAEDVGKKSASASEKAKAGFLGFKSAIGGALAKLGLVAMGIRTVARSATALGDAIKSGAILADQMKILEKDVANLGDTMESTRKASAGMISDRSIVKAAAMFKSFKIPVEELDRALAAVAKTSIRTGQDVKFLTESLTIGLARESTRVLDNLGIVIKTGEVAAKTADHYGKFTDALTEAERKGGLLTHVLESLEEANVNVDLLDSQTAAVARLGTSWEQFTDKLSIGFARAATETLELVGVMPSTLREWQVALEGATGETGRGATAIEELAGGYLDYLGVIAGPVVNAVVALGEAIFGSTTLVEAAQMSLSGIVLEYQSAGAQATRAATSVDALAAALGRTVTQAEAMRAATARATAEQAVLVKALARQKRIFELLAEVETGFFSDLAPAERKAELLEELITLTHTMTDEATAAGDAAAEAMGKGIKAAAESKALREAALATANKELDVLKDELAEAGGMSQRQITIRNIKRDIARQDQLSVSGLKEMIRLTGVLINETDALKGEKAPKRRGGRRRRREDETLADVLDLEAARLRAAGKLTAEQKEQLVVARANVKISEIEESLRKKKITAAKATNLLAQEEHKLRAAMLGFREAETKALEKLNQEAQKQAEAEAATRDALGLGLSAADKRRAEIGEAKAGGVISEGEAGGLLRGIQKEEDVIALAQAYDLLAEAAGQAAMAQDETLAAFGRLAEAVGEQGESIIDVVHQMEVAWENQGKGMASAVAAGISVAGQLATALIKDAQAVAIIEGLVETAKSVAAFASQDYLGGALHAVAAGLWFAVAGDSGASKKASAGTGSQQRRQATAQPPPGAGQLGTTNIFINSPAAVIGMSNQEAGTQLRRIANSDQGTGFDQAAA